MPAALLHRRHTGTRTVAAACTLLGLIAGCSSAGGGGVAPNTAGSASVVPGEAPQLGEGSGGGISVTGTSIVRTGTKLSITTQIRSEESSSDELVSVGSEVTSTLTLSSPVKIPAGATVTIGGATKVVLDQNARLEPGGTVALLLQFSNAGSVQVFSSFVDAS